MFSEVLVALNFITTTKKGILPQKKKDIGNEVFEKIENEKKEMKQDDTRFARSYEKNSVFCESHILDV